MWAFSLMTGIIIGRFQVPYLHAGHVHLITSALRQCTKVVIFLATKLEDTDGKNPYTIAHRKRIIHMMFPHVEIVTLWDRQSNEEWSKIVDAEALAYSFDGETHDEWNGKPQVALFHSRDSFAKHYTGKIPLIKVGEIEGYSGTKLREETKTNNQ
jgi:nicotinamide mononucleotide adenylyltransferase